MRNISEKLSIVLALMFILFVSKISIAQTTYTINTNKVLHTLDEKIYGHFLEHIYNSVNNGLWGDLVWNRSFEKTGGGAGEWTIEDSLLIQSSLSENIRLLFGETNWQDYEISLKARRDGGSEGFLLIFRANGDDFYWLNIAGWGNSQHAIEKGITGAGRWGIFDNHVISGSIATNQWYDLKVRCDGNHFQAWLDNSLIFDFTDDEPHLSGQVGVGTWVTQSTYTNILVTDISSGDTLFSGLPDIGDDTEINFDNWQKAGNPGIYSSDDALNSDRCAKIVNSDSAEAGIYQSAFNIKAQPYEGSIWAKGNINDGIKISLLNGSDTLDKKEFTTVTNDWQEFNFSFNPASETENGTLLISYGDTGTLFIDQVSMMGQDATDNNGFRPDLLEAVNQLKPPIIRWPGGCYVSAYFWKDGIGPQHTRRAYPIELWNDKDVNSYGTDEFLQMCEILGAEPLIVVNTGVLDVTCGAQIPVKLTPEEYLQDALDWMEYCNGDKDTTVWGAVRAANGHPEPYNVKYWEIDNETWSAGVSAYIAKVKEFAPAMRTKYPDVKIIACGSGGFDQTWNSLILNQCADIIDYISTHHYEEIEDYRTGVISYENFLKTLGNNIASSSNPDIKIYMSEWNVWSPIDWRCGLYAGGMLNVFERQGKNFKIGGPALFLRHSSAGSSWNNAFINFNNYAWFPAPNYVVMKLWHDHFAPNYIETTGSNSNLNVVSTLSADSNEMYFKVVNTSDSDIDVILDIDTSFFPGNAYLEQITASSLYSINSFASPDNIRAKKGSISIDQQKVYFTSPKYSAAVVTVDQYPPVGIEYGESDNQIKGIRLYQNHPNPFCSGTLITYELGKAEQVILRVLDLSGRVIYVLVDENLGPGSYTADWRGRDNNGNDVSSGLYFYELITPSNSVKKKMMLVR
jgi:alpha-N-arabinofuranosidase